VESCSKLEISGNLTRNSLSVVMEVSSLLLIVFRSGVDIFNTLSTFESYCLRNMLGRDKIVGIGR